MASDPFDAAFGGTATPAPVPASSDDAFSHAFSASVKPGAQSGQSTSAENSIGSSPVIPGMQRGAIEAMSIFSKPVDALLSKFGSPEIKAQIAKNQAAKAAWEGKTDAANAESPGYYALGKVLGNAAVSVPTMAGEGAVASGLGRSALATLENGGRVGQAVAPYVEQAGNFLTGQAGQGAEGAGNALLRIASRGTAGAAQGAVANAQIDNGEPVSERIKNGLMFGGALGAGGQALYEGGKAIGNVIRPFTSSGQDDIVRNYLMEQAKGGNMTPDLQEYVPGSNPTLAEAMANPGISVTQRNVSTLPNQVNLFGSVQAQNDAARMKYLDTIRGTPGDIDSAVAARNAVTSQLRDAAFAQKQPADATPVLAQIDDLLSGPEGKRKGVANILTQVRESLLDANGKPETDPEMLYGVRKGITDLLTPAAQRENSSNQAAAALLSSIKDNLDDAIETGAPGYRDYLSTFAKMSKPIDAQELLQGSNFTDASNSKVLGGNVGRAIKSFEKSRNAGGVNAAKSLSDNDLAVLNDLNNDFARQSNILLGKAKGSDTVQNLASHGSMAHAGIPTAIGMAVSGHPLMAAGAEAANRFLYSRANSQIQDRLANALADANLGVTYLQPPVPSNQLTSILGRNISKAAGAARPYVVPALVGANRLLSSQPSQ